MPRLSKREWQLIMLALECVISDAEPPGVDTDFANFADECAVLLAKLRSERR